MFAAVGTHPTFSQRIKLVIVAALLMLSLGIGITATPQKVEARPRTHCFTITDPVEWQLTTGYKADDDFVGGMYCPKY